MVHTAVPSSLPAAWRVGPMASSTGARKPSSAPVPQAEAVLQATTRASAPASSKNPPTCSTRSRMRSGGSGP